MSKKTASARSATLAKGLDILNVLAASPTPLRLRDIMQMLGMTKPTAHRQLATLIDYGLVRYDPDKASYQLGMRLFEMSRRVWEDVDLRGAAAIEMTRLHELTGEAVALALIVDDDEAVYVDEIASRHHIRERGRIGQRVVLWRSAIGKALAAGLAHPVRQKLLCQLGEQALRDARFASIEALSAHLDLVNARGYAIEDQEHIPGIRGVAAPIVDHRGLTVAAIGLSGPTERLAKEQLHELGPALIEATRRASLQAGGSPRPVSASPRPAKPPSRRVKTLVDGRNLIGECPLYDAANERLFWVDICKPAIYRYDFAERRCQTIAPGEMVTALALVPDGLLIAAQSGLRVIDPSGGEPIRFLGHPERDVPGNRFNDGKCDSRGRFWVGTLALNVSRSAGALYRIDADGQFVAMETGLTLPNGIGWSPDDSIFYLADTAERKIYAYDFCPDSGAISNRRTFIKFAKDVPGDPDGLAVDQAGDLWVALWDGWRIQQFAPDGSCKQEIILPVPRPTSCTFGGASNKTLYVTSARIRISETQLRSAPLSGAVFAIRPAALSPAAARVGIAAR